VWLALVAIAHVAGHVVVERMPRSRIFWPPLVARWGPDLTFRLLVPVGLSAAVIAWGAAAARLSWRMLLGACFALAAAWAVALAVSHGVGFLTHPLHAPNDYIQDVPRVSSPVAFLDGFVAHITEYNQHVRAHPPGMVLVLWGMSRIGLGGFGWEAALIILGGAAAVPAVLVTVREVAGESSARTAAPFLAIAPFAIYVATAADALWTGVGAWAVAALALATGRSGPRSDILAVAGGALFAVAAYLSYGVILVGLVPVALALRRRRVVRPAILAAVGMAAVVIPITVAGFWWHQGLAATVEQYRAGVSRARPQSYFWYGNLASFAIITGPAAAVAVATLRSRALWVLVGAALVAVLVADASGLSKAEVERIWLPFAPWVVAAAAGLPASLRARTPIRVLLAVQGLTALALQGLLRTTW
jgi:hypothetical protein